MQKLDLAPRSVFSSAGPDAGVPDLGGGPTSISIRNDGEELSVGDPGAKAARLFPKPKRAYEFRELPPQFNEKFHASGWESELEGFGYITFDDQVVAAVRSVSSVEPSRVMEVVKEATGYLGEPNDTVSGTAAKYWFWEQGRHRKMICSVTPSKGETTLTIAIGESSCLNSLRMSPLFAERDSLRADLSQAKP